MFKLDMKTLNFWIGMFLSCFMILLVTGNIVGDGDDREDMPNQVTGNNLCYFSRAT
jgi:hypothetical protein